MTKRLTVLVVEDSADDAALILRELRRGGFDPEFARVDSADDLRTALADRRWQIVVCDHAMPGFNSFGALRIARAARGDIPFIVVSGSIGEEVAVDVMKAGANDYLMKDNLTRLAPAVERELGEAQTRRRLRENETLLQAVIDASPVMISYKDRNSIIRLANQAFAECLGQDRDAVIGRCEWDFRDTDMGPVYSSQVKKTLAGEITANKFDHRYADGSLHHHFTTRAPYYDDDGDIQGYFAVTLDQTGQKQAEGQLRQAQKMEALGRLTGGVAHDFNNLLAVIQGNAEILTDGIGAGNRSLQSIRRAAKRGAELTQHLLAFSRRQSLRPRTTDLASLVGNMSDMLGRTLGEAIHIETKTDPDLWLASIDPGQLENALLNLAFNARDAMPHGGQLSVECTNIHLGEAELTEYPETTPGDYVVLAVTDTGNGMSADVRAHAFEPFYTTKEVGKGSGLGLSMVYGFVQQSGGLVTIDSEKDRGTTVKIYLPRGEPGGEQAATLSDDSAPLGRGETVLVVEDDDDVRAFVVDALTGLNYRVIDVPQPRNAADVLSQQKVDLVLSDMVLPGGTSGQEFIDQATTLYPELKAILMSGYPADTAERHNLSGPNVALLSKPFRIGQLAKAARDALGRP